MFTGIIQALGQVVQLQPRGGDVRMQIDCGGLALAQVAAGDSIAINGVCLTVVEIAGAQLAFDASNETLSLTTLGSLAPGDKVNLESALRAGDPLGGHLVSGHVDAMAKVLEIEQDARSQRLQIGLPPALAPLVAAKGSITIDGTSLTVNRVLADRFEVNIIPHTWEVTIIGEYAPGRQVNLEVDMLARYVARLLQQGLGTVSVDYQHSIT